MTRRPGGTSGSGGRGLIIAPREAGANAERQAQLFAWALQVLRDLGIVRAIEAATTIEQLLLGITLDLESVQVALAINDVLNPAGGSRRRAEIFVGLNASHLKRILANRFGDLKKDRQKELRGRRRPQQPDWTEGLLLNKDMSIQPLLANLVLILRESPKWKGVLAHDEFNARVVLRRPPPWGEEPPDAFWSDHHESLTRVWFQREAKIKPSLGDVGRAVQAAAKANLYHPVRSYFNALEWDGQPRLDTWLIKYFHAPDTAYIRAVGPRWLISVAARIFKPGCKVDHVLVLEGPQGRYKSEALRTLAIRDSWFTDRVSHLASKDAMIDVTGVLIIELSEMDALSRASQSVQKSFITRRHDKFRPPFGRHSIDLPRQAVFAATINPSVVGYLQDPTGARRFWPVKCGIGMIDRDGLERDRDQLWAEAVQRYKRNEPWHLETPALEALAAAEQSDRFKVDPWEEPIVAWLADRTDASVTEVVEEVLGVRRQNCPHRTVLRVTNILTRLGFQRHHPRTPDGRREARYFRDPIAARPSSEETVTTATTRSTSRPRIQANRRRNAT